MKSIAGIRHLNQVTYLLLLLFLCACNRVEVDRPHREIISQTPGLEEKWRVNPGVVGFPIQWTITEKGLIIAEQDRKELMLLDSETGQKLWDRKFNGETEVWSLAVNDQSVFLFSGWRVSAHSLSNGDLLWQTDKYPTHRIMELYSRGGFLFLYEREGGKIYQLDINTGEQLTIQEYQTDEFNVKSSLESIDLAQTGSWFCGINRTTRKILWYVPNDRGNYLHQPPVIVDNRLLITLGRGKSTLYVLDASSGQVIWQKQDVESNPIVLNDKVYVIDTQKNLKEYQLENGAETGSLQTELISPPAKVNYLYEYALASDRDKGIIFTYYQDSGEIIAFQFTR